MSSYARGDLSGVTAYAGGARGARQDCSSDPPEARRPDERRHEKPEGVAGLVDQDTIGTPEYGRFREREPRRGMQGARGRFEGPYERAVSHEANGDDDKRLDDVQLGSQELARAAGHSARRGVRGYKGGSHDG